jgi:hypothetical protein
VKSVYLKATIMLMLLVLAGSPAAHAYTFEPPTWVEEANREWESREAAREAERHKKEEEERAKVAQERREQEERKAQEEKERQEAEKKQREAAGQEAKTLETTDVQRCIVPSLLGDLLSKARHALHNAHCRLGRVSKPRRSGHGIPVIVRQRPSAGVHLSSGGRIAVTMGPATAHRRR